MTDFTHQKRNGRHKKPKERERQAMGLKTPEQLLAHRELEYLRRPTAERARKLREAKRAVASSQKEEPQ